MQQQPKYSLASEGQKQSRKLNKRLCSGVSGCEMAGSSDSQEGHRLPLGKACFIPVREVVGELGSGRKRYEYLASALLPLRGGEAARTW